MAALWLFQKCWFEEVTGQPVTSSKRKDEFMHKKVIYSESFCRNNDDRS